MKCCHIDVTFLVEVSMFADRFSAATIATPGRHGAWRELGHDKAVVWTGGILIGSVLLLCVIHGVLYSMLPADVQNSHWQMRLYGTFSIEADGSIAEQFNYGMSFAAALLFLVAAITVRSYLCLLLAVFMGLAWFDDSANYHERIADLFANHVSPPKRLGLSGFEQGELVAWMTIGLFLLPFVIASWRGWQRADGVVLRLAAVPALLLIISASVFDLFHAVFHSSLRSLVYIEDGGEMLSIALLATVALYLSRNAANLFAKNGIVPQR